MASTIEQLTDALRDHINDPEIKFQIGRKALSEHAAPPRVTWVQTGGQIAPAQRLGPIQETVQGRKVAIHPIYQDVLTVEAHIWAENLERLEQLHRILLGATRTCFGTDSRPGSYQLTTEAERSGYVHGDFAAAVQQFAWSTLVGHTHSVMPGPDAGPKVPTRLTVTILGSTHACSIDTSI